MGATMIARAARTFEATVSGGRLEHESLRELEGARVHVQVTVERAELESSAADPESAAPAEEELQPPEWLDVEVDLYVRMPVEEVILKDVKVIDEGPAPPCIILPEVLPDD